MFCRFVVINGWIRREATSSGIPGPLSATAIPIVSSSDRAAVKVSSLRSLSAIASIAFRMRFTSTCWIWVRSTGASGSFGAMCRATSMSNAAAPIDARSPASSIKSAMFSGRHRQGGEVAIATEQFHYTLLAGAPSRSLFEERMWLGMRPRKHHRMQRHDLQQHGNIPSCQFVVANQIAIMLHDRVAPSVRAFRHALCVRRFHRWQYNVAPYTLYLNAGSAAFNQRGVDQAWKCGRPGLLFAVVQRLPAPHR